jgi:ornithine carbamoyltransferase
MNAPVKNMPKHFLDLSDHTTETLRAIIEDAKARKRARGLSRPKGMPDDDQPLQGRTLAMIFDKQSTRTRISFDMAARQLGGSTLMLTGSEMQLAREETIADTARVISRYVDAIMIRLLDHEMVEELAQNASIPVINGLTKWSHPCQIMADILTFEEHRGPIKGAKVAWTGDGNNVLTSLIHAAVKFGFRLDVASPRELPVDPEVLDWARSSDLVAFGTDPEKAVKDADCVVTDTWVSMGDDNATKRRTLLKPYQVNKALMGLAAADAIFMHCLPAHRGDEVTDDVIDGPQSVVFDEAENRLHAQKAILAWALQS